MMELFHKMGCIIYVNTGKVGAMIGTIYKKHNNILFWVKGQQRKVSRTKFADTLTTSTNMQI